MAVIDSGTWRTANRWQPFGKTSKAGVTSGDQAANLSLSCGFIVAPRLPLNLQLGFHHGSMCCSKASRRQWQEVHRAPHEGGCLIGPEAKMEETWLVTQATAVQFNCAWYDDGIGEGSDCEGARTPSRWYGTAQYMNAPHPGILLCTRQ